MLQTLTTAERKIYAHKYSFINIGDNLLFQTLDKSVMNHRQCAAMIHNLSKSNSVWSKQSLTHLFSKQVLDSKRSQEKSVFIHLYTRVPQHLNITTHS